MDYLKYAGRKLCWVEKVEEDEKKQQTDGKVELGDAVGDETRHQWNGRSLSLVDTQFCLEDDIDVEEHRRRIEDRMVSMHAIMQIHYKVH